MLRLTYGSGAPPPILLALIPRAEWIVTCRTPIAVSIGAPERSCSRFKVKTKKFTFYISACDDKNEVMQVHTIGVVHHRS